MRTKSLGVMALVATLLAACGGGDEGGATRDPDDVVLQITSEGGFVPVEVALNNGPRYTVFGDGRLVYQGAQIMIFPGPLVPSYMVARLSESQLDAVLAMVENIGLPDIEDETDDSAMNIVADASTEVVTYWDENGEHRLGVYALGLEESPSARNEAFLELISTFDRFTGEAEAEPYAPERVRVLAGAGFVDPEFADTRPWPLEDTDFSDWSALDIGWQCTTLDGEVPAAFSDATQSTTWEPPAASADHEPLMLLVRPLLPGESDCP